jgi:hypothetical protein
VVIYLYVLCYFGRFYHSAVAIIREIVQRDGVLAFPCEVSPISSFLMQQRITKSKSKNQN